MDILRRQSASLSERVWTALDEAVAQAARHVLVGSRVATFDGPKGWDHAATRLGTVTPCETSEEGGVGLCAGRDPAGRDSRELRSSGTRERSFQRGAGTSRSPSGVTCRLGIGPTIGTGSTSCVSRR